MTVRAYLAVLPVLIKNARKKDVYERYTAEVLRVMCENTANMSKGSYIKKRYEDIIAPRPEDTRTGDEVIEHMRKRIRGG